MTKFDPIKHPDHMFRADMAGNRKAEGMPNSMERAAQAAALRGNESAGQASWGSAPAECGPSSGGWGWSAPARREPLTEEEKARRRQLLWTIAAVVAFPVTCLYALWLIGRGIARAYRARQRRKALVQDYAAIAADGEEGLGELRAAAGRIMLSGGPGLASEALAARKKLQSDAG